MTEEMTEERRGSLEGRDTLAEHSVLIAARAETVWAILSDPERFGEWLQGKASFRAEPGSAFEVDFPQFDTVVRGEVLECDADRRRLAVTWGVASGAQAETFPVGSSKLELWLEPEPKGTRAHVRHSALPSETEARNHEAGWRFHFSRLSLFANRADLRASLGPSLDAWFGAWNETDADARGELIARCSAPDVEFRDEYASLSGVELLALHIGNTQHFIPGWRIERAGEPRICRGEALVDWEATGPDEQRFTGTNHVVADPDGTIRRVTSFWNS